MSASADVRFCAFVAMPQLCSKDSTIPHLYLTTPNNKGGHCVNYIQEINSFYDYQVENPLTCSEQALWHKLMSYCNSFNWKSDFSLTNSRLVEDLKISRQQLDRARNTLVQNGLITYKKGNGNQCGTYHLNSLSVKFVTQSGHSMLHSAVTKRSQSGHSMLPLDKLNVNVNVNKTKLSHESDACVSEVTSVCLPEKPIEPTQNAVDFDELTARVVELYNTVCTKLPPVTVFFHASRTRLILNLWNVYPDIEMFKTVFTNANNSSFLTGGGKNKWVASIDWLLKQDNFVKIFEGNYNNSTNHTSGFGSGESSLDIAALDTFWDTVPKLE